MWGEGEAMVPIGQHLANLRRKGGLGKDPKRAAERAAQLAAIDEDWNCPWPLNWQRHYRVLADLVDADGVLPYIAPGVTFDGDDIGAWRWKQQNAGVQAQLMPEQRERLAKVGIPIAELPQTAPAASRSGKGPSKARQAFQRGTAALTQWVEREGTDRPVPRGHTETITIDGEPVTVKLGVWISNTKSRRDRLETDQLAALAALGMSWAQTSPLPPRPAPRASRTTIRTRRTAIRPSPYVRPQADPVRNTTKNATRSRTTALAHPSEGSGRTPNEKAAVLTCHRSRFP
ncbi:hypothetical protein ABE83_34550 [Streptomyces sp. CFMR 7]|nr:hypothetical protein ABE83_34550 [Streptomyces sp. CFMR 7]